MIDRRSILGALATLPLLGGTARAADDLHTRIIPGANTAVPVIGIGAAERYEDPDGEAEIAPLRATIKRFVELSGTLIDTAPSYGRAEALVGQLVEELAVRDRLFLATKVSAGMFRTSRSAMPRRTRLPPSCSMPRARSSGSPPTSRKATRRRAWPSLAS